MILRTVRGMLTVFAVTVVCLAGVSAPTFAITTPTPIPTDIPALTATPTAMATYTPSPTALLATPTTTPLPASATPSPVPPTATPFIPTLDPLIIEITETVAAATATADAMLTADAMNSLTPGFTSTMTLAESTVPANVAITETVAAVTASAANRATQTAEAAIPVIPTSTPPNLPAATGNGGQTLLVAVLIALGLIVVAFSQATRRR